MKTKSNRLQILIKAVTIMGGGGEFPSQSVIPFIKKSNTSVFIGGGRILPVSFQMSPPSGEIISSVQLTQCGVYERVCVLAVLNRYIHA